MAVSLKHTTQTAEPDSADGKISADAWNEEHALTLATDKLLGRVSANTGVVEEVTCTDFIQTLLDDADAATARTTLGLVGKQTIWIPASAMSENGAESTSRIINSIKVSVLAFDTSSDEGANFSITLPKSWNAGTVTYQVHWTAASGSGTVEFELRGGCFINDAAINVSGLGTAVAVADTLITADDVHVTAESAAVTLSNAADDAVAFFELIRDVSDDSLGVDAELIGIKLYYTTDATTDA